MFKFNAIVVSKVILAILLLSGLAGVAGSQLAPDTPLEIVLLNCAVGAAVFLVLLVLALIASLTLNQFILRNGGTDTQWFWFPSEPKGLQQLRADAKKLKSE